MSSFQQTLRAKQYREAGHRAMTRQQWSDAAREFGRALHQLPKDSQLWLSMVQAQMAMNDLAGAQQSAERLVELEPHSLAAVKLLAECLRKRGRSDELLAACARLPAQVPRDEELLMMQAEALLFTPRMAEAVPLLTQALQLNIKNSLAHFQLGLVLKDLNMASQAAVCFETAVLTAQNVRPDVRALALSRLVFQLALICDWPQLQRHKNTMLDELSQGSDAAVLEIAPFTLLALESSAQQQLRVGQLRCAALGRSIEPLAPRGARRPGRLRIGYLSSDFFMHATAILMTELLELRDRERFEIFLYCHSPEDGSPEQLRLRAAADHFRSVKSLADVEVARLMREDDIDIVIDLKGHTHNSRMHILGYRPAPVQVSYLGYPGSTGAAFIDYVVGDAAVTPLAHAPSYSERIAQMPHSYQPNDSRRALPPKPPRALLGLPEDALVLSCFNQSYKITAEMADLWAQILKSVPQAVLWLLAWNEAAQRNLSKEMVARGIDASRLLFSPLIGSNDNLARLQCADLVLDTWPCNAHTTASEALWAGVPVLTVPGETFASRVAASLVQACELPAFVCASPQAYVDKAVSLLTGLDELRAAQAHLREQRMSLPLFDSRRYTRDFEALLLRMWERHEAGLAPAPLSAA